MSPCFKLISAGLPAPSMTTTSTLLSSASYVCLTICRRRGLNASYSMADMTPTLFPLTIT